MDVAILGGAETLILLAYLLFVSQEVIRAKQNGKARNRKSIDELDD